MSSKGKKKCPNCGRFSRCTCHYVKKEFPEAFKASKGVDKP